MIASDKILNRLKECVRENRYIVTLHAEEEMDDDELSVFDVEHTVLTGKIIEKQKDDERNEWKYLVRGETIDSEYVIAAVKISPTGKMVIITVFRDE